MRAASSELIAYLNALRSQSDARALVADCYTISLRTGLILTYTNADVPISLNGYVYSANSVLVDGLKFKCDVGLNVDQQQITLSARSTDTVGGIPILQAIRNGLLDGAEIQRERAFLPSWTGAPIGSVILFKGRVGAIDNIGRTTAQITVNSDLVLLDIDMPRNLYSPSCQHRLYDSGCTLVKNAFGASGAVGSGSTNVTINWSSSSPVYTQGTATFISGANTGVTANVKSSSSTGFQLSYPLDAIPAAGDAFTIYQGCDHTQATCKNKFNNLAKLSWVPLYPAANLCDLIMMTSKAEQRAIVVAEARKWIRTPYHSGADVLGAGVHCGMLLVRVFVDTGLVAPFEPRPYPEDWHLHRSGERYLGFVVDRCQEVSDPEAGDVVVFKYGRCFSHGGIVTRSEPDQDRSRFPALWLRLRRRNRAKPAIDSSKQAEALFQPVGQGARMSFLHQRKNTAQIPLYTGLQVQTSSGAVPIQIVYGANKIAPNVLLDRWVCLYHSKVKSWKGRWRRAGH